MKIVKSTLFFWHTIRANYFAIISDSCLDKKLKLKLEKKSSHHRLEAIQYRAKNQNINVYTSR
ncbi:hypothetical protein [Sutcliffiella rhizosphaerae]|uniref:hypothetical protein n=1 Tax=Sutcliffiella rhizosphaerae TaxID=2880967 RepID=UPI001E3AC8E9|nr:hypothetical protein [Sutcliffiella rhizosphaerae]